MIAFWNGPKSDASRIVGAMRAALSRFGGINATEVSTGDAVAIAGQRDSNGRYGTTIATFSGWIDNAQALGRELGVPPGEPARLYAACLERWGDEADARILGSYAAAARLQDGTLHLSRAPWDAPPLYYHAYEDRLIASPLLRVLFAAGAPRKPDYDRIVDELAYDFRSGDEQSWYHQILMVPLGGFVRLKGERRDVVRWYDPPRPVDPGSFDESRAVEQALGLLDDAANHAFQWASRPALAMSGGLDSTLVAEALVRAAPADAKVTAITFAPDRYWDGKEEPGTMGDERPLARLMAETTPRLDWHVADGNHGPHDRRAREVFAASETFAPGLANVGMYHNVYAKARELGCDSLLTADFGNSTISVAGRSAYVEFTRTGDWAQLLGLLRSRPGDARPLWRKLCAMSLLPQLPRPLRALARQVVHPRRKDMRALITPLSPEALRRHALRARGRGTESAWADLTHDPSRLEAVRREWRDADGPGRDVDLAFEQLYGIRKRDVLTYRPLVEFCMSLPTKAFAWNGEERRLARLMGRGRVPEAIRTNRLHGQHNVDWHARLTPSLGDMRETLERARSHPFLGEALDIDRLQAMIDDWPDEPDFSWERDWPLRLALPRAILAARFIGHIENRNEF